MAQHVHDTRRDTLRQEQRRTRVPEVVEPDPTHAGPLHQLLERPRQISRLYDRA
jgi:hypothetical protein